jgi:hypothetical protein
MRDWGIRGLRPKYRLGRYAPHTSEPGRLELLKDCDVTEGTKGRRSQSSFIVAGWQLWQFRGRGLMTTWLELASRLIILSLSLTTMVEITIRKRQREDAVLTQRKFFKKTARGKVIKGAPPSSSFATRAFKRLSSHPREISQGRCLLRNRKV